jgi:hypothetical protein
MRIATRTAVWYSPPPLYLPDWIRTPPPKGHQEYPDFWAYARDLERGRYGYVKSPDLNPWVRQIIRCVVSHDETITGSEAPGADAVFDTGSITLASASLVLGVFAGFEPGAGSPRLVATTGCQLDATTNFTVGIAGQNSPDGDHAVGLWYLANAASGSHTVRFTLTSAQTDLTVYVMEVLGAATSSPADSAGASANGTSTTPATGNHVATNTDNFWIAAATSESTTGTPANGTGWTIPTNGSQTTSGRKRSAVEYIANPGTATEDGNFTGFTSAGWAALVMPFKAAAGGGGGGKPRTHKMSLTGIA